MSNQDCKAQIDLKIRDDHGRTAFICVDVKGPKDVVKLLLLEHPVVLCHLAW